MTFRVGQKVCCVDSPMGGSDLPAPPVGSVSTVIWSATMQGIPVIDLREFPFPESGDYERGIPAIFFRPVVETDISALQALLVPGAKIREDA